MIEDFNELSNAITSIAQIIKTWKKGMIQIVYTDALDKKIAAISLAKMFADLQVPFVLTSIESEHFRSRKNLKTIFIGVDEKKVYDYLPFEDDTIFIVNPTDYTSVESFDKITILNIGKYGYLANNSSFSSVVFLLVNELVVDPSYHAILAILYIKIKELQRKEEPNTIEELILQIALERKIITLNKEILITGKAFFSIKDALLYSTEPIIPHITGNSKEIEKLLYRAEISTTVQSQTRMFIDLDKNEIKNLFNQLLIYISDKIIALPFDSNLIKDEIRILSENQKLITHYLTDFAQAVIEAEYSNRSEVIMSVLLGERTVNTKNLQRHFLQEKREVINYYLNAKEAVLQLDPDEKIIVYENPKIPWYKTLTVGKMLFQNSDIGKDKIAIIITKNKEEKSILGIITPSETWKKAIIHCKSIFEAETINEEQNAILVMVENNGIDAIIKELDSNM